MKQPGNPGTPPRQPDSGSSRPAPLRRALLGVLATVGVLAAAAPPFAVAEPAAAAGQGLSLNVEDLTVPINQQTAETRGWLSGPNGSYSGVTIVIDARSLAGLASLADPSADGTSSCTDAGGVWTCVLQRSVDLTEYVNPRVVLGLRLTSTADATVGAHATIRTTLSASGTSAVTDETTVTIGEDVRLRSNGESINLTRQPGERIELAVPVSNIGVSPSRGAVLRTTTAYEIPPVEQFHNCWYADSDLHVTTDITCVFDTVIEPGDKYQCMLEYQVRTDSIRGSMQYRSQWSTPAEAARIDQVSGKTRGVRGTGRDLLLTPYTGPIDRHSFGLQVWVQVTGDTPIDLAAIGATVTGEVGQTVTARIGVRNVGKVTLDSFPQSGDTLFGLTFAVPPGTTVVDPQPQYCNFVADTSGWDPRWPGTGDVPAYFCEVGGFLRVGDTAWWQVSLRIDRAMTRSTGRVHVYDAQPTLFTDSNPADNTATLTVLGSSGASLPVTGAPALRLAIAGGLLVLAGLVITALVRRQAH